MKKQILTLALGFITVASFAQKKELRAVEKMLSKDDFKGALTTIKSLDKSIDKAEDKYKSKYYFLKGKTLVGLKKNMDAAKTFHQLLDFEKKNKKNKYSLKAEPVLTKLIHASSNEALDLYNNKKDYKGASKLFYQTYKMSPVDTTMIYNAAVSSTNAKDYDSALKYYKELKGLGYTGIEGDSKSKKGEILRGIALILVQKGKQKEALTAIKEARAVNPKDTGLILEEANINYSLKNMDEYGKLVKEAITLKPNDSKLYYNLGVVSSGQKKTEDAIKYYKKAVELEPNYYEANMNLASLILKKNNPIIEEINKNLSNQKKYNTLVKKQKAVYREALPYVEKADELKRDVDTVMTLKEIYEFLAMKVKAKKFLKLYKEMR